MERETEKTKKRTNAMNGVQQVRAHTKHKP